MKTNVFKLMALMLTVLIFSSLNLQSGKAADKKTIEISLPSIQCGMCVKTLKKALGKTEGIIESKIDLKNKKATITFDDSETNSEKIEAVITAAGYDANDKPANADAYEKLSPCCKKPE